MRSIRAGVKNSLKISKTQADNATAGPTLLVNGSTFTAAVAELHENWSHAFWLRPPRVRPLTSPPRLHLHAPCPHPRPLPLPRPLIALLRLRLGLQVGEGGSSSLLLLSLEW